jgi:hypothetical protein
LLRLWDLIYIFVKKYFRVFRGCFDFNFVFIIFLNVAFLQSVINDRRGSKIGFVRNVHYSNDVNNFFILHPLTSIVQKTHIAGISELKQATFLSTRTSDVKRGLD